MRCSPRPNRGGYSPYELAIGMKHHGLLHALRRRLPPETRFPRTCVDELERMMQAVRAQVRNRRMPTSKDG